MAITRLNHIGVVVEDIDAALRQLKLFLPIDDETVIRHWGYEDLHSVQDAPDTFDFATVPVANFYVEMLQPTLPGGRLAQFLDRSGGGVHHVSLESDDIQADWDAQQVVADSIGVLQSAPMADNFGILYWYLNPKKNDRVMWQIVEPWGPGGALGITPNRLTS